MEKSGTMCLVGCQSVQQAGMFRDKHNVQTIGFKSHVILDKEGGPAMIDWIKNNKIDSTMMKFERK